MRQGKQWRPRVRQPASEPLESDVAYRNEPLSVTFSDDAHEPSVDRQVLEIQANRLGHAKPRGVQKLDEGAAAKVSGRLRS
jgi:hypothetical protein